MHSAEVDRLALDREMDSARLQVLQAQIEPHFLFNTLANVRRLYQTDADIGREMLANLMRYLEVALPRMRDDTSTLEREAALIEAFLNVQKIRMGRRLTFEIDIDAELQSLSVPPMMLLTLVENALKHGLNPLPEGGGRAHQRAGRERAARAGRGRHGARLRRRHLRRRYRPGEHSRPAGGDVRRRRRPRPDDQLAARHHRDADDAPRCRAAGAFDMTTAPRFRIVADDAAATPGWSAFVRGVARRLTWQAAVVSALVLLLLNEVRDIGAQFNAQPGAPAPDTYWISSIVILGCQWLFTLLAVLAADEAVERAAPRARTYVAAVTLSSLVAAVAQYLIRLPFDLRTYVSSEGFLVRITQPAVVFTDQVILCGLATFVYVNLRTARHAAARRQAAEIARLEAGRRTLESRLQAMQARVEPQFLFNTLAQVRQLYQSDPPLAGKMLDDLIAYLRAALPHLRESSSTLGKEAALARAYLDIVRVRLGERLAFDIDIPPALADARMPPMMLLPLIDHALVYGLEPTHSGGSIRIDTHVGQGKLRLSITDSGAGFVPGGNAVELDNIGERLFALYGDDAALRLQRVADRGTQALLEIPYELADRSDR